LHKEVSTVFKNLSEKFQVLCFVDLADLAVSHGAAFQFFKSSYKNSFADNERLVFYSSHRLDQDFLNHLQRAITKIDISNFFVLFCTPEDLTDKLKIANQLYGNGNSVISNLIVNLEPTKPFGPAKFYSRDTFCPLPFGQLYINTTGEVRPCCKFDDVLGNINTGTLKEIFYGRQIVEIRRQMQRKQKPTGCQTCWVTESLGVTSFRQHSLDKYGDVSDYEWIDNVQIRDLNIAPNNLCNFVCRICSPVKSSKIASEELQYTTDQEQRSALKKIIKLSTGQQLEKLTESLGDIAKDLQTIHVMGGEPFLIPGVKKLLTTFVDLQQSGHISLEFNTNGSTWPAELIPLFDSFQKVEILLSIDNVNERFEVERGGNWANVFENIQKFASIRSDNIIVKLAPTVNIQTLLYLEDIVAVAEDLRMDILWWYLERPGYLCIDHVNENVKKLVYQKYNNHRILELAKISDRVQKSSPVDTSKFVQQMDKLDLQRKQQFSQTHKEIYEAMKQSH